MNLLKNIFGKRKEENLDPRDIDHAEIIYTDEALENGSFDDYNKEILIIRGRVVKKRIPFSVHEIQAIKKVDKIPIWDRTADSGEEFKWNEVEALTGVLTISQER